jgi:type II secretory pathway pseudopilin PulG
MNRSAACARHHATFALIEMLTVVAVSGMLALVLARVLTDVIRLSRLSNESSARIAAIDSLSRTLRADALSAREAQRDVLDDTGRSLETLALSSIVEGRWQSVEYVLAPDLFERRVSGTITHAWSAPRLEFAWEFDPAPSGALLLTFIEYPPPYARGLAPRNYPLRVSLSGSSSFPELQP